MHAKMHVSEPAMDIQMTIEYSLPMDDFFYVKICYRHASFCSFNLNSEISGELDQT